MPQDAPGLAPTLKYGWSLKSDPANPQSAFNQVMAAPVVGDIDGDGIPEIIFSSFSAATDSLYDSPGVLRVLDGRTGALKASLSTPGLAPFGSTTPLLIDLAGDGTKQIIYTTDGATLFDFNGDGKPEIIYGDQNFLRIFDAANGDVLFKVPNPSATLMEYPVVADVDGDGDSELVVVTNNIFNNDPNVPTFYGDATAAERAAIDAVPPGVRVFKAATDAAWMPTRAVWNQYSYFINNVTDDLKAVSSTPNTAASGANLFRQNLLSEFKDACAK